MLNITQDDYNIIRQTYQTRYIRLDILDFDYRYLDSIEGFLTEASFNINANSDIRRSCNLSLVVYGRDAGKLNVESGSEIWLDKLLRPSIGIENARTGKIRWYKQGIFLINRPTWDWDSQNNTLKFDGIDLMAQFTGQRNGVIGGTEIKISSGENVRDAFVNFLELSGFPSSKINISECTLDDGTIQDVPNDITLSQGSTYYDVFAALRDILPSYQIYFDVDGVFHYNKIPTGKNETVEMDDILISRLLTSESINTDFASVKNYIEVYGRPWELDVYPTEISISDNTLNLTIPSYNPPVLDLPPADWFVDGNTPNGELWIVESDSEYKERQAYVEKYLKSLTVTVVDMIDNGAVVGFRLDDGYVANEAIKIKINNFDFGYIRWYDKNKGIKSFGKDLYVLVFTKPEIKTDSYFSFYGKQQVMAIAYDNNPESPFYIDDLGNNKKVIKYICHGGEYDNITNDLLAEERAKYELYLRDRLQDNISLYMIPVPWLDVNVLIRHIAKDETLAKDYIIQSMSYTMGAGDTMSIIANRYYPLYQDSNEGN